MVKQDVVGAVSDRQIAGIRFFLALTGLLAIFLQPSEPNRLVHLTYTALIINTLYGALIYAAVQRVEAFTKRDVALMVWTDVVLYSILISLSGGTHSIFFFFYFFAIIEAGARLSANAGVAVTCASAILFMSLAYLTTPAGTQEWNRFLMRSASLAVVGYLMAYWARVEHGLRQKLEFLRDVALTSNPRFGVDRTAGHFMKRVQGFFKADTCILVEIDSEMERYRLRCASVRDPEGGMRINPPPENMDRLLRQVKDNGVALYSAARSSWGPSASYGVWYPATQVLDSLPVEDAGMLAEWLGAGSFLQQLADQVLPVLEHIRLVDRMASDSAEEERRRIARSVHDRIIQPYLGIQMGLVGVRHLVQSVLDDKDSGGAAERARRAMAGLENLIGMTRDGVEELRQYVYDLRTTKTRGENLLIQSLLRYAAKFEIVTGIRVTVVNRLNFQDLNDRLAIEIFQMATEALSNVRRHTSATAAVLTVEDTPSGKVAVGIENEVREELPHRDFVPRSITERAESLGGNTRVINSNGHTLVSIEIPL
jgi:signal transduction histidine kinase